MRMSRLRLSVGALLCISCMLQEIRWRAPLGILAILLGPLWHLRRLSNMRHRQSLV